MSFNDMLLNTTLVMDALRGARVPAWLREIAAAAGIDIYATRRALDTLVREGRVACIGEGEGGIQRYQVVIKPDLPRVHLQPGPLVASVGARVAVGEEAA